MKPEMPNVPNPQETEDRQRDQEQEQCTRRFIEKFVASNDIFSDSERIYLTAYLLRENGEWRYYDGKEFFVTEIKRDGKRLHIVFGSEIEIDEGWVERNAFERDIELP